MNETFSKGKYSKWSRIFITSVYIYLYLYLSKYICRIIWILHGYDHVLSPVTIFALHFFSPNNIKNLKINEKWKMLFKTGNSGSPPTLFVSGIPFTYLKAIVYMDRKCRFVYFLYLFPPNPNSYPLIYNTHDK